jgi:hypothetical protein
VAEQATFFQPETCSSPLRCRKHNVCNVSVTGARLQAQEQSSHLADSVVSMY